MTYRIRLLLAAVLALVTTAPVSAALVAPGTTFDVTWMINTDLMMANGMPVFRVDETSTAAADGTIADVRVMGSQIMTNAQDVPIWDAQWDWLSNADPFVTNNFTITNNAAVTQNFIITSTIGIVPIAPASLTSGSVGGSLTDNNTDATLAQMTSNTSGNAIYTALIDGAPYQTLLNHPFSLTVAGLGANANIGPASFGLPPNSQPGPAIANTIGIRMEFDLTPGDAVSFTSRFEVAVPVPAAVWLFGSGLLGLAGIARRKHS